MSKRRKGLGKRYLDGTHVRLIFMSSSHFEPYAVPRGGIPTYELTSIVPPRHDLFPLLAWLEPWCREQVHSQYPNSMTLKISKDIHSSGAPLLRRSPFQLQSLKHPPLRLFHCLRRTPSSILQVHPVVRSFAGPYPTTIKFEAPVFAVPAQVPLKSSLGAPA